MVCPQCGYDMGNANKCMRCGYIVKTLTVVKEDEQKNDSDDETPETIVIDPSETYITSYGYDDDMFGGSIFGDPFSALFGDIFDPIGDLLGGLFGIDIRPERPPRQRQQHATEEDMREHKKRKREAAPVVEVNNVEIVDENGDPVDESKENESKKEKHAHKHKDAPQNQHPHYRRKDKK